MKRVLIVYGTTDGHTRKVADSLAEALRGAGCRADVVDAATPAARMGPEGYSGVLVAASIHGGKFQGTVRRWVAMHAPALNGLVTGFVAVCLAVLESKPEARQAVNEIMQRFFLASGWTPTMHKAVAGALLYTRYNWVKRWIMKRIVRKAGGDTDTSRDYEYTDWPDLHMFAREFAARLPAAWARDLVETR